MMIMIIGLKCKRDPVRERSSPGGTGEMEKESRSEMMKVYYLYMYIDIA
jgi:hypothetical protein